MAFDPSTGYLPGNQGYAPLSAYNQAYDPNTGQQGPTGGVGANPLPNLRYGYQGPNYNPTQGGIANNLYQGYPTYSGNSIDAMAQSDRNLALYGGQQLQQNINNYTGYQYGQSADFQDRLNSAWDPIAQGNGGYTDDQKNSILNNPALQALQQTPDQANSLYLNGEQQAAIAGNPYASSDYANQAGQNITGLYSNFADQVGSRLNDQSNAVNGQLVGGANNIRNAYNTQSGKQQQNLSDIAALTRGAQGTARSTTEGAYGNLRNDVGNSMGQLRSDVSGALDRSQQMGQKYLDPTALNASSEYMNNYNVSPRDQQNIEDKAGRTVGAGAAADEETLMQQAAQQGNTNPLAIAAARNRIRSTGAVNAANAMSDAAIQAKQLQLNTTQGRENTRLGAAQNYAGLGTGANLALGQQRVNANQTTGLAGLSAAQNVGQIGVNAEMGLGTQGLQNEQYMGSNTLGTQNQLGQNAISSEQQLSNQQQQAQQYLGQSNLANTQQLLNTGMQQGEFNAGLGTSAMANAESQASNRANTLATNQQGVNAYNQGQQYNRGQYIYGQGSQANLNFANNQQGQENNYRQYLGGQQQQYAQNTQVGQQQQLGAYNSQNQATQGATRNAITNYAIPGFGNTIYKDAASAVGLATPHAKGGVRTGPTPALIGEAGPELLVHLNKLPKYGLGGAVDGDDEEASSANDLGGPMPAQQDSSKPNNPMYKQLLRRAFHIPSSDPSADTIPSSGSNDSSGGSSGGGLGGDLVKAGLSSLFLAQGGLVGGGMGGAPNHYYGSHSKLKKALTPSVKAPGAAIEMIKKPTIRPLGVHGPDAVIPLTDRPGNKLKLGDLPNLAKKYGGNFGGKRARI